MLAEACAFDRAAEVADEKLFGAGPPAMPLALGAWDRDALIGVAAVAGNRIRVLAVAPGARRRGIGAALLAACEAAARDAGQTALRTLDQPGNYLAPGIDERNAEAIGWLERRGWRRLAEPRVNALIDVRDNPRVSARARRRARRRRGRARLPDPAGAPRRARRCSMRSRPSSAARGRSSWSARWAYDPPGVHVAVQADGAYCAFAAHDGNNRGLGWFGPTGTWPAHRGRGLGEALLLACLVDVAAHHARCEVAWIGPRPFYDKVAGIAAERRFVVLTRAV